jgi:hypothetical protein
VGDRIKIGADRKYVMAIKKINNRNSNQSVVNSDVFVPSLHDKANRIVLDRELTDKLDRERQLIELATRQRNELTEKMLGLKDAPLPTAKAKISEWFTPYQRQSQLGAFLLGEFTQEKNGFHPDFQWKSGKKPAVGIVERYWSDYQVGLTDEEAQSIARFLYQTWADEITRWEENENPKSAAPPNFGVVVYDHLRRIAKQSGHRYNPVRLEVKVNEDYDF